MKQIAPSPDWSDEARYSYEHDLVEWWDPRPMPHRYNAYRAYIAMLLGIIEPLAPRRVLNVGCAQGTIDLLLAERGVEMTSLEIRPGFLEYAKLRHERGDVTWVLGDFFEAPIHGAPFDLVMSHHAIEHVTQPHNFVRRMAELTRPGGHVLLTTPNHGYFRSRLPTFTAIGDPSRFSTFANSCDAPDHIFAFTREELCQLGVSAGLRVEHHFFYESVFLAGHMRLRYLHQALPGAAMRAFEPLARIPGIGRTLFHNQGVLLIKPASET